MKKRVAAALAAALLLAVCAVLGCGRYSRYTPRSYEAAGAGYSARVIRGAELILDLDEGAAGHTWAVVEQPDNFACDTMSRAPGVAEFHIIALKEGAGTMRFQRRQDREGGGAESTYALRLDISRRHAIYLQIESVSFERME